MSISDRIALDSDLPPGFRTHELFRVVCGVCDRHGWEAFMGYFDFDEAEYPEPWVWFKSRGRLGKMAVVDIPMIADDFTIEDGFTQFRRAGIGIAGEILGPQDAPLKPRCDAHNHQLKVLSSEDVVSLIRRARTAGRDWVVIPE